MAMGGAMIEKRMNLKVWTLLLSSVAFFSPQEAEAQNAFGGSGTAGMIVTTTVTTHSYDFPSSMPNVTTSSSVANDCNIVNAGGDGDGDGSSDPLVLDLTGNGVTFLDRKDGVLFDMDEDGNADLTSWVGPDAGFLVLDRNGDGIINDHSEMFGTETLRGFDHLALYDSNDDGIIDRKDDVWKELKVWVDSNSDGISQPDELKTLKELGIKNFNLEYTKTAYREGDSQVISEGFFEKVGGAIHKALDVVFSFFTNVAADVYEAVTGKQM